MSENKGMVCPVSGCSGGKILVLWIAAFATVFAFEWVFHCLYMMPAYEATASVWRTEEAMQEVFHFSLIGQAGKALAVAMLFGYACCSQASCGNGSCTRSGIKFGIMIGLLWGFPALASYTWLPIPLDIAVSWFVGEVLQGIALGIVLTTLGKCCKKQHAE